MRIDREDVVMERFNLIHSENSIKSNARVEQKDVYFDIYISPDEEVCIIGKLDNNFSCWCSITSVNDTETNAKIFDYITSVKKKIISNEQKVLRSRFDEIKNWHRFQMHKREHQLRTMYYSPISPTFISSGKIFANEIQNFSKQEKEKCEFRLKDLTYKSILATYKKLLSKHSHDDYYYNQMKPLIKIIESESYLKLCPESEIRALYLECINLSKDLYNRYMTAVR